MFENPTDETRRALKRLFEQHQRDKFRRALEEHLRMVKKLKEARKEADND
jgi:hypothetical protein